MKKAFVVTLVIALLGLCIAAQATVNIETVVVGDPNNAGELSGYDVGGFGPTKICGVVKYIYCIGKYEVTAGQYCEFLNAKAKNDPYGLYNTKMSTDPFGCKIERRGNQGSYTYTVANDWANRPVNFVSFWDALYFANWLHNGQGNGDIDGGAYTMNGCRYEDGRDIQRNTQWKWAVTSEDEWYKAAYYKGGGTNAGYWDYATQSDKLPSNVLNDPANPNNIATYYIDKNIFTIGAPYYRTEVGTHKTSVSAYGTYDQCGNVWEMNECLVHDGTGYRGLRGASYIYSDKALQASYRYGCPIEESRDLGFRVVKKYEAPAQRPGLEKPSRYKQPPVYKVN